METSTQTRPEISQDIDQFVKDAQQAFGDDLISIVLFGSAAEGQLRITSDVNMLIILKRFSKERTDMIREPLRLAHAAIHLDVMFLLESELGQAMEAFATKFSDILDRRRVLVGPDLFDSLTVSPDAMRRHTRQVLLNLMLRMRNYYALISLREDKLVLIIADLIGPLRTCAASIKKLEGINAVSPKEAFGMIVSETSGFEKDSLLTLIDTVRRQGSLPTGAAEDLLFTLIGIAERMYYRISLPTSGGTGAAHA
jgi:predicted nucleotidyltransferase